ncbi:MAG: alanine dehydrogenase [Candidatus Gastranaerophilales bacterium]|nr:alanine dehydrogenase [Candidatus Gastranaerophilales bacterium]
MRIGVPKEIKSGEYRVALVPANVQALVQNGHEVFVEKNAGINSDFDDELYKSQGAVILDSGADVYKASDLIIKVQEPQPSEYGYLQEHQILFTYLHLATDKELTNILLKKKITAIAYETIETSDGSLPLLVPMSEVAGKMSVQIGANLLEKQNGGAGVLVGGVAGVPPAKIVIVGAGVVGVNAARVAVGLGADVRMLDSNITKLRYVERIFGANVKTYMSNEYNLTNQIKKANIVIGAVLVPGNKTPKIVSEKMVKEMKKGSVIVDVAIDQGGCVETMDRITSHTNPTFEKYGVIHYSVANIAGAVSKTSTVALTNATQSYLLNLADLGLIESAKKSPSLAKGINTYEGKVTNKAVAEALGLKYSEISMQIGF